MLKANAGIDSHGRSPEMRLLEMSTVVIVLATAASAGLLAAGAPAAAKPDGVHDFDFLVGEWRVHHRRWKQLPAGGHESVEFDGTSANRLLMGGSANLEECTIDSPSGAYRAVALRAYDAETKQWSIWWLDGRYPSGPLDPPVRGGFENGVGTFYSDYVQDGKPVRLRFLWSHITPTSARWEQALSPDGGKTWETNWVMEFRR
jgi:hypothetical protein